MTVVIGFNWPPWHDNTVSIIVDGKLVFASEEERHTRHKHAIEEPPFNAMVRALKHLISLGINPNSIDAFAINFNPRLMSSSNRRDFFIRTLTAMIKSDLHPLERKGDLVQLFIKGNYHDLAKRLLRSAYRQVGATLPEHLRIIPVEHHLAHAASTYYFSGFSSCAVMTVDGMGETECTTVYKVKNGNFEKILSMPAATASLGNFFDAISSKLGFKFLEGPGKVMGLAPYGNANEHMMRRFDEVVKIIDGGEVPYRFTLDLGKSSNLLDEPGEREIYSRIANYAYGSAERIEWDVRGDLKREAIDYAWACQHVLEKTMLSAARWTKDHTGEDKIALAGGVALNAKANMEIHYADIFNDIFICPAANDAGSTFGAAAYVYEHVLGKKMSNIRMNNVYLGPEYSDDEIKSLVTGGRWKAEYVGEDVSPVADAIAKGKLVTWFQGRAELGPRALGNRSIVANPTDKEIWPHINSVKGREWWRPLAPSLLSEDVGDYFEKPVDHEFMILMLKFAKDNGKRVPAVCHVDGTARPQTVKKSINVNWYNLIKAFKEVKGEGLVMNTSFNLAGEPLVETPKDAIRSFAVGGFDAMYMQGWFIKKR